MQHAGHYVVLEDIFCGLQWLTWTSINLQLYAVKSAARIKEHL